LAATTIYPCKNKEAGCEETFTVNDRDKHLAECLFQNRECPFRKFSGVDCNWNGPLSDIALHVSDKHDETSKMPGHFKLDLLNFVVGWRYCVAVLTLGEIFYLAWEMEGDTFRFGVFHLGPEKETYFVKLK
jgi:hypothetical protein